MAIILVQLLFLTMINAEYWDFQNATDYGTLLKLERSKRVPFHRYTPPDTLTATIKDGDKEIRLNWNRVMKKFGKTIMYHDIAEKSALMYIENQDWFYGVVGQSYQIRQLGLDDFSQPLIVGDGHVDILPHHQFHGENKIDNVRILKRVTKCGKRRPSTEEYSWSSTDSAQSNEESLPERYYVETLLFVAYDIFEYFSNNHARTAVTRLMLNILLHFQAVDMIFAMLPQNDFEVYINLAGVIIEEEDGLFSEILKYEPLQYNNRPELIHDDRMLNIFEEYSSHFDFPFPRDSFDMIIFMTSRQMFYNGKKYYAWTVPDRDILEDKRLDPGRPSVPSLIIKYTDHYSQYPSVASFIGRLLGIQKTVHRQGSAMSGGKKCYSIMLHKVNHCTNCLTWTRESISQLKDFLSDDTNRCFLLNVPRSLYPSGTKIRSLSPCRQCTCFQYYSYAKETTNHCPLYIPPENCGELLQCKYLDFHGHLKINPTIFPFDGTPCGENKVCWDEKCTSL